MHESNDFNKLLMQYALNDKNYKKALEFYDGTLPDESRKSTVSKIIYDIATLYMVSWRFSPVDEFLCY